MADSIKISELGELVSGSVQGTTKVPVVDGGTTKYTQASSLKAYVNSDVATDAELSSRIATVNSTIDGLTTADISENASYLYYTDTRVTNRLNALNVLSGSSTSLTVTDGSTTRNAVDKITFSGATVTNDVGAGDVTVTIESTPSLTVGNGAGIPISNVDKIDFTGATITDNGNGDVTVAISGGTSTDISALNTFSGSVNSSINRINISTGSLNSFTSSIRGEINGIEEFTASFSSSVQGRITTLEAGGLSLPNGVVSSSTQIDYNSIQNTPVSITLNGIVSSSQQIVGLGFVTTSSLATETNFHIISQSIIATDPIDSNLLLSSVYIDKTKTIKFSQFSQSLDARIASAGGGGLGGDSYISNVTFGNNRLTFTGVSSAFNGSVTLSNGIVSSSTQITDLGFLTATDVNQTYINNRLPIGLVSSSAQISNLANGVVSSSAQIVLLNAQSGGFDTSRVAENVNYKYYTDDRVQSVINGLGLISGSLTPSGSVSSSSQIDYQLVYNKVVFYTGSNNLIITSGSQTGPGGYGNPWVSLTVLSPSDAQFSSLITSISSSFNDNLFSKTIISGSTQISNLGFVNNASLTELNNWTGSIGVFGTVSSSLAGRIVNLSNLTLTASGQIDYNFVRNTPTFLQGSGILISQSLENAFTITSNASAPTWDSISLKPYNIVSSSLQVDDYHLFAKTGSTNTFYGNQTVYGELQTTDLTITGTSDLQGGTTFGGISTFNGPVVNDVGTISVSNGQTASLDFSLSNWYKVNIDVSSQIHLSASNMNVGQIAYVHIYADTLATASFSSNVKQPFGSFYTASSDGIDILTFTSFDTTNNVYLVAQNKFV
jgi:hypothetical protein